MLAQCFIPTIVGIVTDPPQVWQPFRGTCLQRHSRRTMVRFEPQAYLAKLALGGRLVRLAAIGATRSECPVPAHTDTNSKRCG